MEGRFSKEPKKARFSKERCQWTTAPGLLRSKVKGPTHGLEKKKEEVAD